MKSLRFISRLSVSVCLFALAVTAFAVSKDTPARPQEANPDLFLPVVASNSGGQIGSSLAVADLNGDGYPDVVVANSSGESNGDGVLGVILGNGDGTFQPVVAYDAGCGGSPSVAIGDLNGDGIPDVVLASSGCVAVLLGKGNGVLQPAVTYSSGGKSAAGGEGIFDPVLIVDVNGDGIPDVLVLNQTNAQDGDGSIGVLLGKGNGALQPVKTYDSGGFAASSFAVADINHDGHVDLVVANCGPAGTTICPSNNGTVALLLGNGNGTFQSAQTFGRGGTGNFTSPVAVADLNGDGIPDLVVGNSCPLQKNGTCGADSDGTVGILLGKGNGTFKPAAHYDSGGDGVVSLTVVDVNLDGKLDVVVASGGVGVLRGKGDGTFWLVDRYFTDGGAQVVLVADLNLDGKPDLIAANGTSSDIAVLLGNGSGFTGPTILPSGGYILSDIAVSDVNRDGRPDLLAANWCSEQATCAAGEAELGTLGVLINNPTFIYDGTTTTLASSANPAPLNQPVSYTATVTRPGGASVTGTIVFSQGGKQSAPVNLVNNQAVMTLEYETLGTRGLQAIYSGDANNVGSTSLTLDEYIKTLPVASKTTLATSGSPSQVDQLVTFTATVTSKYGSIPNGELVTFYANDLMIGTSTTSNGIAGLTTSFPSAKTYFVQATYSGDDAFKPSSGSLKQVVNTAAMDSNAAAPDSGSSFALAPKPIAETTQPGYRPPLCPSQTKFYEADGGPYVTESFTLGARANMNEYCHNVYHAICTGQMYFYLWEDGKWNSLGTGTYVQECAWQLQTTTLPTGTHRLKAIYTADQEGFGPSSALSSVDVEKWPTTASLTSSPNPSTDKQDVTFTVTVVPNQYAPTTPTGKVRFVSGATTLGSAAVNPSGVATFVTRYLPEGTDTITAEYLGDSDNASSTAAVSQVVNP
ncbi:MAG: FG-GAP-like repeat-containing protein [Terriglobales bacterium]|jgi:hypothetical protein